jgi:hypothetical protein
MLNAESYAQLQNRKRPGRCGATQLKLVCCEPARSLTAPTDECVRICLAMLNAELETQLQNRKR